MSMDYIPNNVARCDNHRCLLRTNCARYMQIAEERKQPGFKSVPYTRFEPINFFDYSISASGHRCDKQIKLL